MANTGSTQNHRRILVDRAVKASQLRRATIEARISAQVAQKEGKLKSN